MARTRSILFLLMLLGGPTLAVQPALSETQAPQPSDRALLEMMKALEKGSLGPSAAQQACHTEVTATKSARSIREVSAGLFQVAEQDALNAFCAAMVAAVKSGQISSAFIEGAIGGGDEAQSLVLGRVVRVLYYAHLQNAERSGQEAPQ